MKNNNQTDLTLIILNYNSRFWLKKTLSTLKKEYLKKSKYKIKTIVVDNNSEDDSVLMVKKEFKWVELIELAENIGFAAGNNVALKDIQSKYVMLCNNDLEFTQKSNLDSLINYMNENEDIAVITPKLLLGNNSDGKIDMACHRGEPTPWASFTYFTKLEKLFPNKKLFSEYHQLYKGFDSIHQIDDCSGAAMLVKKSAIDKIGLLDERFFMYAEDLDWCKRFRNEDYKVYFYPDVEIIHHKYKSGIKSPSDRTSKKIKAYFYDTMLQYFDKHYSHYPRIYKFLLQIFVFIKKGGE